MRDVRTPAPGSGMAIRTTVTDGLLLIADWRACSCFDHHPLNSILPSERVIYNGITHRKEGREAGNNITNDQSYKLQSAITTAAPAHLKMVLSGVITG